MEEEEEEEKDEEEEEVEEEEERDTIKNKKIIRKIRKIFNDVQECLENPHQWKMGLTQK